MPEYRTIIAGFGGQGVVLAGNALARGAIASGKFITGMTSYGVEVRGGTSNSTVVISDDEIFSPVVDHPNILIALNQPSVDKFVGMIARNGFCIVNSSMIKNIPLLEDVEIMQIPATQIAHSLGCAKAANIVALGCLIKKRPILTPEIVISALRDIFAKKTELFEVNRQAFSCGFEYKIQ
jgi:2-oxoglutarate ferredoxin oxidoreductase subunit gamma